MLLNASLLVFVNGLSHNVEEIARSLTIANNDLSLKDAKKMRSSLNLTNSKQANDDLKDAKKMKSSLKGVDNDLSLKDAKKMRSSLNLTNSKQANNDLSLKNPESYQLLTGPRVHYLEASMAHPLHALIISSPSL